MEIDKAISLYLKSIDVKSMEFFEEMFDHISTSFEQRLDKSQGILEHIREDVEPAFGGAKKIRAIQRKQGVARNKMILTRSIQVFKSYLFSWPHVGYTLIIVAFIWLANQLLNPKMVLMLTVASGVVFIFLMAILGMLRFSRSCKKEGKPYRSSEKNGSLLALSFFASNSLNLVFGIPSQFILPKGQNAFEFYAQFPAVQVFIASFYVLIALSYFKIHKEEFINKIAV